MSELKSSAVKYILSTTTQTETPSDRWASEVASFLPGRTYDYVCAIVLIYGALERFIEDIAVEYLEMIEARSSSFSVLPEKIRRSHFNLTLKHLERTRDARYSGKTDAPTLAASLAVCLADTSPYSLNTETFLHHSANFRVPVVDEFLGRISIPDASNRAALTADFETYNETLGSKKSTTGRQEGIWDLIGDLVVRRNQVAHGDTSNSLAASELLSYCAQVRAYCCSLSRVVRDTLGYHLSQRSGIALGNAIAVYNHSIVCLQTHGVVIAPGAMLVGYENEKESYSAVVTEIQINNVSVACTPLGQDIAAGFNTDGRCKAEHSYFLVR